MVMSTQRLGGGGAGYQTKKVRMGSVSRGMGTSQDQEAEAGVARMTGK